MSHLRKCLADEEAHVPLVDIELDSKLNYVEEPIAILYRQERRLRNKVVRQSKGTTGTKDYITVISSVSLETNKTTHGPFGGTTDSVFTLPWDSGSLVGFYGLAGYYIDSIGVYLKAHEDIMSIGTWGKNPHLGSPQNKWSFQVEKNHHLKNITIDHGDLIYSLIFTTVYGDIAYTSDKIGGWGRDPMEDGDEISELALDLDEEINAISGTVALSRGTKPGFIIISSISFRTNKKTHGPFGTVRGDPFTVAWEDGSFVVA
ncbi:mannose/glucose-specific lectin-like [Bidens hawaiensis]|uniref:mannose/glucose-specific lectin-like n=1 Tax=Bidens hawaiensis TaxID=980011 RepID=UPI00404B4AC0